MSQPCWFFLPCFHQRSSGWSLIRVVFYQGGLSPGWSSGVQTKFCTVEVLLIFYFTIIYYSWSSGWCFIGGSLYCIAQTTVVPDSTPMTGHPWTRSIPQTLFSSTAAMLLCKASSAGRRVSSGSSWSLAWSCWWTTGVSCMVAQASLASEWFVAVTCLGMIGWVTPEFWDCCECKLFLVLNMNEVRF